MYPYVSCSDLVRELVGLAIAVANHDGGRDFISGSFPILIGHQAIVIFLGYHACCLSHRTCIYRCGVVGGKAYLIEIGLDGPN